MCPLKNSLTLKIVAGYMPVGTLYKCRLQLLKENANKLIYVTSSCIRLQVQSTEKYTINAWLDICKGIQFAMNTILAELLYRNHQLS